MYGRPSCVTYVPSCNHFGLGDVEPLFRYQVRTTRTRSAAHIRLQSHPLADGSGAALPGHSCGKTLSVDEIEAVANRNSFRHS